MIRQNIGSRRSKVLRYWEWGLGIRPRVERIQSIIGPIIG
jgi:hypothetical protein